MCTFYVRRWAPRGGALRGIVGRRGALAAFALDVAIPAFLRGGALEVLEGQLDLSRDVLSLRTQGVGAPLKVNQMEHFILGVVTFGEGRPRSGRFPEFPASFLRWAL